MMKPKAFYRRRYLAELFYTGILALLLVNAVQSFHMLPDAARSKTLAVYFSLQALLMVLFGWLSYPSFKKDGLITKLLHQYRNMPIPKGAKIAVTIVLMGNIFCIAIGKSFYPFYDVGMFRWTTPFKDESKIVHKPKYYYWKGGQPQLVDLRKESIFFLADYWSWGYTHEFTFAAAYHNKSQKENFDFILSHLKPFGVDSLWVGVQTVDYGTGKVTFDPDICKAIHINDTVRKIHYGKIYIPEYQKAKCHD